MGAPGCMLGEWSLDGAPGCMLGEWSLVVVVDFEVHEVDKESGAEQDCLVEGILPRSVCNRKRDIVRKVM